MENIVQFKFALREDLKDNKEFLPCRAEPFATGYDVRAAMPSKETLILYPGSYFKIPLGFRAFPPCGWWFKLYPRSSSFTKKYMHNLIGIIDEHYSNEVVFAGQYLPTGLDKLYIKFGEAIGQIVPVKRQDIEVVEISNEEYNDLCGKRTSYRQGGFGSTSSP